MKFLCIVYTIVILQIGLIIAFVDDTFRYTIKKTCSTLTSHRVSTRVPYLETYKEKTWGIFYKTKARWNYRIEFHTVWRKEYVCCDGYKDVGGQLCRPLCQPACGKGICIKPPNICLCYYGYTRETNAASDYVCNPVCTRTCVHGKCTAPEVCTCDQGYSLNADGFTCEPVCDLKCDTGSYCSEPDFCACLEGYTDIRINNSRIPNRCDPVCEKECVNGECTAPNTCTCDDGYEPDPDDLFVCKPTCVHGCVYGTCTAPNVCTCDTGYSPKSSSVCEPICSQACVMGTCMAPESCGCFEGYGLLDSSKYICEPVCERSCLNGRCTAPDVCACNDGFRLSGDESARHICEPHCEIPCEPFGVCSAPNVCVCFAGYRLADKTRGNKTNVRYFAGNSACEPICDAACVNGFCSAPQTCTCNEGYRLSKRYPLSNVCEPHCEIDCVNGHCSAPNECTCDRGYRPAEGNRTASLCEPVCMPSCRNGVCVQPDVCSCNEGHRQSARSANTCDPVCHAACEPNGICEAPDRCVCKDGYRMTRYDGASVPFACEPICDVDCGNGTCTGPNLCACFRGYRNAPTDGSCEPVCTGCNNGTCVVPEYCECDDGFVHVESLREEDEVVGEGVAESPGSADRSTGNGSRCVPRCESCDNGDCVAPDECRCRAGFARIDGVCVNACNGGCGVHGVCIDERRACECDFGWTGLRCDRPTLCVLILDNEENRTDSLLSTVEERNATIEHVLMNNPVCMECVNKVNNETLCFNMYVNGTTNETQIGCLMNAECLTLRSQYRDQTEIIKISGIAVGSGILLLSSAATATYVILRKKRRNMRLNSGCVPSTSLQGLVAINS